MSEDDHKITVETETVEAPVSSLLMSTAEANRPSSVKQNAGAGAGAGGVGSSNAAGTAAGAAVSAADAESVTLDEGGLANSQGQRRSQSNTNGLPESQSHVASGSKPLLVRDGAVGGSTVPGTNINLIDLNPLSPHVTQTSLRNKKSSLLIDSSLSHKGKKARDTEEVPKHSTTGSKKDGDSALVASSEDAHKKSDSSQNHTLQHSISNHSSKNGSAVPTPLMLPVAATAIDSKSSKTLERSKAPLMHSREILLEDNNALTNSLALNNSNNNNNNTSSNKAGSSTNSNEDPLNVRHRSSSGHRAGDEDSDHELDATNKQTKADVFAARLASAVGENEISDSEETFIYESAANSTKNTVTPIRIDMQLDQSQSQQVNHGIASKMSVPVLNNNAKLLTRLKDTRHTSMGALPLNASTKNVNSPQFTPMNNVLTGMPTSSLANTSTNAPQADDLKSMSSSNRQNNNVNSNNNSNSRQIDMQSVKSFVSEPRSPDKRMSLISLTKGTNNIGVTNGNRNGNTYSTNNINSNAPISNSNNTNNINNTTNTNNNNNNNNNNNTSNNLYNNSMNNTNNNNNAFSTSRKPSVSNSTLRHFTSSQAAVPRTKAPSSDGISSAVINPANNGKRNLRTTASKLFDANGAPLRRYSGVPDDVNLEDYIEQSNGHLMTTTSNSIKRDDRLKNYMENNHLNDFKRASHDLTDFEHTSAIQEVAEERTDQEADEDDMRSMFYYNHRGDLEARPQISDYDQDDDDEELDDDNQDDHYYNYSYGNDYVSNSNINPNSNLNRQGRYFGTLPSTLQPNGVYSHNGPFNPNANEYTSLQPKKQFLRDPLGYSPHNFYTRKSSWAKIKHFIYFTFVVVSLLTVGFILGFLLATNKELQDFNIIIIDNILSSADELLFDITATAFNPGFFVLQIQDVNLDIFAKSAYIGKTKELQDEDKPPAMETLKLGTVYKLETPLKFAGGFIKRNYDVSVSSVKLLDPGAKLDSPEDNESRFLSPGQDKDDETKKWRSLIKHDYDLIFRGNMKYKIPFFRSEKSIAVQGSVEVHPDKDDDDQNTSHTSSPIVLL
ncbi:hypothetical protein HG535_0D02350 [Zygotorulaspora mrakii]|uniref:Vacuolar segregation protein 7 n=1 Tax=Zygotorulaspora mrakii TaxID=42260 RepID=A0A7H9B208_ZYGMR|nr:uncharacterized protein HG535_0D02350 [Zygotorulaspora mrakii]QLG72527.1 hypothetical protein HG535_0D02350 [Zygotorulaspora mrakii]